MVLLRTKIDFNIFGFHKVLVEHKLVWRKVTILFCVKLPNQNVKRLFLFPTKEMRLKIYCEAIFYPGGLKRLFQNIFLIDIVQTFYGLRIL